MKNISQLNVSHLSNTTSPWFICIHESFVIITSYRFTKLCVEHKKEITLMKFTPPVLRAGYYRHLYGNPRPYQAIRPEDWTRGAYEELQWNHMELIVFSSINLRL